MAILTEVKQLVDGVDVVTAKDIMDTQETAINANNNSNNAVQTANEAKQKVDNVIQGNYVTLDTEQNITAKKTFNNIAINTWNIYPDASGNLVFE